MDEKTFWQILEEILRFGEFIVAVPSAAASANIVGKISVGRDGGEIVIERGACHCHVHLKPEKIAAFNFRYVDAGYGDEPCCELLTCENETAMRLYLRLESDKTAKEKFARFASENPEFQDFIRGVW